VTVTLVRSAAILVRSAAIIVLSAAVLELRESQTTFTHGSKKDGWKRHLCGIVDRGFAAVFEHEHEHEKPFIAFRVSR
jgi:hypothetical protein